MQPFWSGEASKSSTNVYSTVDPSPHAVIFIFQVDIFWAWFLAVGCRTTLTAGVETPISPGTLNVPELPSSSEDINFCGTQIGAKNEKFLLILSPPKNSVWLPIIGLEARSKVKLIKPVQLILSGESWDFMYCAARFAENCSQPRALLQGRSVVEGVAAANCQRAGVEMAPN